ncbi:MAG: mshD [Rhodoglobus sp.]|nr:mshD [Rhodoglobus sp.]
MIPELEDLIARARAADGSPPFSDGALVQLANGERELVWESDASGRHVAVALDSPTAAEFVVDPDARRLGHGARMLDMLTHPSRGGAGGTKLFWAHGDHPASRALARHHKLEPVRTLLHLHAPVPLDLPKRRSFEPEPIVLGQSGPESAQISVISEGVVAFDPADADAWVELNARIFAGHPEQGGVTRADLDTTMAQPWFDARDFLLLKHDGALIGYVWLKIEGDAQDGPSGEFYVVGVGPGHQGEGLGRQLMNAGFARLAERGIHSAHLYVEADNAPALRLYRQFGFVDSGVDVQYHYTR